ncbi:Post-GPI attachment to proteins factor 3 [Homalodisca vitripennis]|nr:Post-GPI attachment to proteins factor 3 [Homalodisca vitripennis]
MQIGRPSAEDKLHRTVGLIPPVVGYSSGILSAGVSAVWSLASWRQVNHSKYLATVVVLGLLTTLLEVSDFPPYLWAFDAHALWHLSTTPIPYFFWRRLQAPEENSKGEMTKPELHLEQVGASQQSSEQLHQIVTMQRESLLAQRFHL